ncbi:hypothetical protein B2G71_15295 [Novosphingobium sp. PC22D]|uniref:hypothetical protein n=1 Tax=Novosphingobium sp. PC22D TaxID=1962403 RepID=UPI000BF106CB|nr:hypothetical protein [Novosphingobium sp. PC22D]PEQ11806.1 hypothetical protein B2G71_15295 [Novosphingobium sp. PC22D]
MEHSLSRIEAAIERIEAVASRVLAADAAGPDADLAQRHEALKQSVARTIADIDAIIADPPA